MATPDEQPFRLMAVLAAPHQTLVATLEDTSINTTSIESDRGGEASKPQPPPQPQPSAEAAAPQPPASDLPRNLSATSSLASAAGSPTTFSASSSSTTFAVAHFQQALCPICLEHYTATNPAVIYQPCRHAFHLQCAESWLMRSRTCPVCSAPISSAMAHVMTNADVRAVEAGAKSQARQQQQQQRRRASKEASASSGHHEHADDTDDPDATPLLSQESLRESPQPAAGPSTADVSCSRAAPPECAPGGNEEGEHTSDLSTPQATTQGAAPPTMSTPTTTTAVARTPMGTRLRGAALFAVRKFGTWCCM